MDIRRRDGYWLWVGGPVPPGYAGITIWTVVSVRRDAADDEHLLRHEAEHVRQWRRHGPFGFLWRYVGSYLGLRWKGYGHAGAYHRIPFEIEAERAASAGDEGRPAVN